MKILCDYIVDALSGHPKFVALDRDGEIYIYNRINRNDPPFWVTFGSAGAISVVMSINLFKDFFVGKYRAWHQYYQSGYNINQSGSHIALISDLTNICNLL